MNRGGRRRWPVTSSAGARSRGPERSHRAIEATNRGSGQATGGEEVYHQGLDAAKSFTGCEGWICGKKTVLLTHQTYKKNTVEIGKEQGIECDIPSRTHRCPSPELLADEKKIRGKHTWSRLGIVNRSLQRHQRSRWDNIISFHISQF